MLKPYRPSISGFSLIFSERAIPFFGLYSFASTNGCRGGFGGGDGLSDFDMFNVE
jgi:hypothetical protein